MVKLLLKQKAYVDDNDGWTALYWTAKNEVPAGRRQFNTPP
jgi:hypothetical protein